MTVLLRCPNCQSMDHLSQWIQYTADTFNINIIPAAKSPVYVCPKCFNAFLCANIQRINHWGVQLILQH